MLFRRTDRAATSSPGLFSRLFSRFKHWLRDRFEAWRGRYRREVLLQWAMKLARGSNPVPGGKVVIHMHPDGYGRITFGDANQLLVIPQGFSVVEPLSVRSIARCPHCQQALPPQVTEPARGPSSYRKEGSLVVSARSK